MTWIDFTTYFETLPSDRIDLALRVEADRMLNAVFDPEETELERTVIISERQGNENNPGFLLGEALQAAAFQAHSYHHSVIGWQTDLETMTRDQLYNHYRTYYAPNNAIVAVAGDFKRDDMLARIQELFGSHPARARRARSRRQGAGPAGRAPSDRRGAGHHHLPRDRLPGTGGHASRLLPDGRAGHDPGRRQGDVALGGGHPTAARASTRRWSRPSWPPTPTARSAPTVDPTSSASPPPCARGAPPRGRSRHAG